MRVAVVDPSAFSVPYDHHLCSALADRGGSVRLFAAGEPSDWEATSYVHDDHFYSLTHRLFGGSSGSAWRTAFKGLEHVGDTVTLALRLRRWDPDVVHFQWLPVPPIDRLLLPLFSPIAPLVLTVHNSTPFHGSSTSKLQLYGAESARRQFDHLVAHTDHTVRTLRESGVPEEDVSRIDHGVIRYPGVAGASSSDAGDRDRVLLFGTVKEYKGVDVLLEAIGRLPPTVRETSEFVVAGSARMDTSGLHRLVDDLGIGDCVTWDLRRIPHDEVGPLLDRADVVVFPYRDVDQSGALMTVLPAGKPIVASSIGGFPEVLSDDHGALVPPEDPSALAEAMAALLEDESTRMAKGQAVRELAETSYSWSRIAEETLSVYRSLQ